MASEGVEYVERDEAGKITATYVQSETADTTQSRIDIIQPEDRKNIWQKLLDVFLPSGYPHSVTEDYLEYQIYDSLQAFSSSIAGLLASRAVLQGVGVGDATATPTAALLLSILQESMGRIATILFAHRLGTALEPECKLYRLLADVFNDLAMVLDCLSPAFPKPVRVAVYAAASVLRALCGVAAGSSKASLSAHFARWANLGELNAKDSSQETVISLLGMLAGTLVVAWVTTPGATWATLVVLLSVHLGMNYRAVRAVSMTTVNRQRANIVFNHWLVHDQVLTPVEVSRRERVFERDGVLRGRDGRVLGYCRIGVQMSELLGRLAQGRHSSTQSLQVDRDAFSQLTQCFTSEQYLLWLDSSSRLAFIVLKQHATTADQLKAWCHALLAADELFATSTSNDAVKTWDTSDNKGRTATSATQKEVAELNALRASQGKGQQAFARMEERLRAAGWDLDTAALETHSRSRITLGVRERS